MVAYQRERIATKPGELADERKLDLTGTTIPAIAGLDRFKTAAGVYYEKAHGLVDEPPPSDILERGRKLEKVVLECVAELQPDWKIEPANEYVRIPELRMGCSPDARFTDATGRRGNLQLKTTSKFMHDRLWVDGPPPNVVLQTCHENFVLDVDTGFVGLLIIDGFHFQTKLFEVPRHPAAEQRLIELARAFWRCVETKSPPLFDFARDAGLVSLLYPKEKPGEVADLRTDNRMPELLEERERLMTLANETDKARKAIEAEIKTKVGTAEAALCAGGWSLTFKVQDRKAYSVAASSSRVLRVKAPPKPEAEAAA